LPCAEISQQASQQYEGRCTGFSGPLVLGVRTAGAWFIETLHTEGNAVIAFFTIALVVSTTLLWFSTDKAARAAETSAIAAKQTVDEIRANAERELRAYVYVRPKEMLWYVDLKKLIVKNSVTNTSKTPAYDIRHFADAGFQRYPFPNDFVVQDPPFRIGTPKPESTSRGKSPTATPSKGNGEPRFCFSIANLEEAILATQTGGTTSIDYSYAGQYNDAD
jgi:hypothetical protein